MLHNPLLNRASLAPVFHDGYFSILSHDCINAIAAFFGPPLGIVRDPFSLVNTYTMHSDEFAMFTSGCFDADDNLVIPLYRKHEVRVYDVTTCQLLRKIAEGQHKAPYACVQNERLLFVSETAGDCVAIFDGDVLRKKLPIPKPYIIALDATGTVLYVCSLEDYYTVKVILVSDGSTVKEIGKGTIKNACGIAISSANQLVVHSFSRKIDLVHIFDCAGDLLGEFQVHSVGIQCQIACDAHDNIYLGRCKWDPKAQCVCDVAIFTLNGVFLRCFCYSEAYPRSVAISRTGLLVVSHADDIDVYECKL